MKRKLLILGAILLAVAFTGLAIIGAINNRQEIHSKNIQIESKNFKLQKLETEFKQLNEDYEKAKTDNTLDSQKEQEYQKHIQELEDRYKALEVSKAEEKAAKALAAQVQIPKVAAASTGGSIDCNNQTTAKAFMYCHESGNDPTAMNAGGCRGLGQACPGSKLPCGADYACQDAWFTNYMQERYGSWEAAKAHWLARVPINGRDVGNWW
jgi:outer membrane murein-binding lipoprotein Lpp